LTPGPWPRALNVLAIRLDAIGDVLMTSPALRALRSVEGTRITLLTSPAGAGIARLVPEVDDVLVYEAPWMKHTTRPDPDVDLAMAHELRRRDFDAAVIFTVFSQSALPAAMLCHLARIPARAAHCRENPYHLLTDWIRDIEPGGGIRHEVRRQLDLAAALGRATPDDRLSLCVPDDARARVRDLLSSIGVRPDDYWAVVHPGATASSRRYPPELFAEACSLLAARGVRVVLTGSASDRATVDSIVTRSPDSPPSLAGRLELAEFAALVEAAPVVVTNNTGPAHIAAAVGTPVVVLYALTNPQHTPWRVPSRVLFRDVACRNCFSSVCREAHHACLRGVPPAVVASAALELVDRGRGVDATGRSGGPLVPARS
jgi:lipopolysaccharide heptosyltransferase II